MIWLNVHMEEILSFHSQDPNCLPPVSFISERYPSGVVDNSDHLIHDGGGGG